MALVKDCMGSAQTGAYNGNAMGDISSLEPYGFDEYHKVGLEEGNNSFEKTSGLIKNSAMSHSSSSLGSPSSANSSEFVFQATNSHQTEEAHSLINFRGGFDNFMHGNNGSLLSFQQNHRVSQTGSFKGDYSTWDGNLDYNYQWSQMNPKCNTNPRLLEDFNCFQTTTNFNSMTNAKKENHGDWLYSEATIVADSIQESATQDPSSYKGRPNMGESMQALKKQCNSATRKPKPKSATSKDPQSIAAKNRRERISERLKILQELVPNGSKVDLVTMLDKAISYVKFLQLQVKVLATDEFWPVQGGKAPDISQVKEAIGAILSSQRDRNSSSSSK